MAKNKMQVKYKQPKRVRNKSKEIETDNTKKVSELKSKYEAGTLSYDTKDVAKAFLKEAVGIY